MLLNTNFVALLYTSNTILYRAKMFILWRYVKKIFNSHGFHIRKKTVFKQYFAKFFSMKYSQIHSCDHCKIYGALQCW